MVRIEDIIGLKIQASVNDPKRRTSDWADVRLLIEHCASAHRPPDWNLIGDYLKIFHLHSKIDELKQWYESPDET